MNRHSIRFLTISLVLLTLIANCKKDKPATIPVISSVEPSSITDTTAISGGSITDDGSVAIIACGVCWGTEVNPTIEGSKTTDNISVGKFVSKISGLKAATLYHLRAYATNSIGTAYGADIAFSSKATLPKLTSTDVSLITTTTAASGGNIINDGGTTITSRGVCWSTNPNPTITDSKTTDGTGIGIYTSNIRLLKPNTTYHLRAYATNSIGTVYGDDISFATFEVAVTDIDGNSYHSVTIGTQIWTAENLKTTHYADGTPIPKVLGSSNWNALTVTNQAYCWYNDDSVSNFNNNGALYTWAAAMKSSAGSNAIPSGIQGVCPSGWHLPSMSEWREMKEYLIANGYNYDETFSGNKIAKSLGSATSWNASSVVGAIGNIDYPSYRNKTGFTALPSGGRIYTDNSFFGVGIESYWWSTTENGSTGALGFCLWGYYTSGSLETVGNRMNAFSVRCLKD